MFDKIPTPPWYGWLNKKLEGSEWLVDVVLITIAVACVVAVLRTDRVTKTAFLVYLASP